MSFFPKKMLLATDGSEDALIALRAAANLSQETDSELHVVYVGLVSYWVHPDPLSEGQYARLRQEAQRVLDEQVGRIGDEGGTVAESYLRMGRADAEVIRLSEEIEAELLVVGSRGQGSIQRILLGDDAESIVRHAPCPVLLTRPER